MLLFTWQVPRKPRVVSPCNFLLLSCEIAFDLKDFLDCRWGLTRDHVGHRLHRQDEQWLTIKEVGAQDHEEHGVEVDFAKFLVPSRGRGMAVIDQIDIGLWGIILVMLAQLKRLLEDPP